MVATRRGCMEGGGSWAVLTICSTYDTLATECLHGSGASV